MRQRRPFLRAISNALAALCGFVATVLIIGTSRHLLVQARSSTPAAVTAEAAMTAKRQVSGVLEGATWEAVKPAVADVPAVYLVMEERNLQSCEDLGRQTRRLRRVMPATMDLVLVVSPQALGEFGRFLKREHVPNVTVVAFEPESVLTSDGALPGTPAALYVEANGRIIRGVAHTAKFRNIRAVSFAEELGFAEAPVGRVADARRDVNGAQR